MNLIEFLIASTLSKLGYARLKFGYELFDAAPRVWAYGALAQELPSKATALLPDSQLVREATEAVKRGASISIVGFPVAGQALGEVMVVEAKGNSLPANERRALAALAKLIEKELVAALSPLAAQARALAEQMGSGVPEPIYSRTVRGVTVTVAHEAEGNYDLTNWPLASRQTLLNGVMGGGLRPRRIVAHVSVAGQQVGRSVSGAMLVRPGELIRPFAWRRVRNLALDSARSALRASASQMQMAV